MHALLTLHALESGLREGVGSSLMMVGDTETIMREKIQRGLR